MVIICRFIKAAFLGFESTGKGTLMPVWREISSDEPEP
jgi:hypothetical protein